MKTCTRLFALSLALGSLVLLNACGQKGPLYLPQKPQPKVSLPGTAQPPVSAPQASPASAASASQAD